jgi:hypothetical protein
MYFNTLLTARISDLCHLTFGCLQLARNISTKFMSHVMVNCKLPWENGFENSLKTGMVVSNERETIWKNVVCK